MSASSESLYMLLFHGNDWDRQLSREQTQQRLERAMVWFDSVHQRGIVRGTHALARSGASISREKGECVLDGPYAESKEILGGYLLIQADSLEDAMAVARQYPMLDLGIEIEVRPVLTECPIATRLREQSALVTA